MTYLLYKRPTNVFKFAIVAILMLFFAGKSVAQKKITISTRFTTDSSNKEEIKVFDNTAEAENVLDWIVGFTEIKPNYEVKAAEVDQAEAVLAGSTRYIVYNEGWLKNVTSSAGTDWSKVTAIAHEMAHHLSGHTLLGTGSYHNIELEADKFCGFVLNKMGASLDEAKAGMEALARKYITDKYPPKTERLEAVSQGWLNAESHNKPIPGKTVSSLDPQLIVRGDVVMVFEPKSEGSRVGNIGKGSTLDFEFQANELYGGDLLIWVERKKNGRYEKLKDQNHIFSDEEGDVFFTKEYLEPIDENAMYEVSYSFPFKELHLPDGTSELRISAKYCKGFKCIDFPYGYLKVVVKN
jgi:hypothetical protein